MSDADIDPSFPAKPPQLDLPMQGLLPLEPADLQEWIASAHVTIPDDLLRPDTVNRLEGPWVAVGGYLEAEDAEARRRVFGFVRALLVRTAELDRLRALLNDKPYPGNSWIPAVPTSHYVFAGELPWSTRPRLSGEFPNIQDLYRESIDGEGNESIGVEIPVHQYSWESYHSALNNAGGRLVPAITFADAFDLRAVADSLDWCDTNGRKASLSLAMPGRLDWGNITYIREDLVHAYCDAHDYELIWIVWGERELYLAEPWARPAWVQEAWDRYAHIWRRVIALHDLDRAD